MAAPGFVHLHVHSHYSFFDSTLPPERIAELAHQTGCPAVALTDTNSLSGAVLFYKAAQERGLRPIIGVEITQPFPEERQRLRERPIRPIGRIGRIGPIGPLGKPRAFPVSPIGPVSPISPASASHSPSLCQGDPARRVVLLARSFGGYSELSHLVTRRSLDPEFDLFAELPNLSPEVIVLSDSVEVLEALARAGRPGGLDYALLIPSRRRRLQNRAVYERARALSLPLTVACDVKLASPDDAPLHDLLQAMRRLTTIHQLGEHERIDPALHFQTEEEIRAFFRLDRPAGPDSDARLRADLEEALASTARLAQQCDCRLPLGEWKFPRFGGQDEPPARALRRMVDQGLRERYGTPVPAEARRRADEELAIIERLHFTDYFLLVHRIVAEARSRGFHTIGRGSAANSIVTYALGISNVCPIRHDLYFERFLNPERSAPPDIDIDFSWKERDAILTWCFDFFGPERVALISTVQTLRLRQAVREVAKAHGLSESEVNAFNRFHETGFRTEEPETGSAGEEGGDGGGRGDWRGDGEGGGNSGESGGHRRGPRVHNLADTEPWRTILAQARRLAGFPRHLSIHCGGIVIAPGPVADFVPLARSAKGYAITQMDMVGVEELGLIKIDLLGNRSLGMLEDAIRLVEEQEGGNAAFRNGAGLPPVKDHGRESRATALNPDVFAREAVRMKLPGTRRGTSVALAGVLRALPGGKSQNHTLATLENAPVRRRVFDFEHVTGDPATRTLIDSGRTMGCFYIESPGMRALFERLRCRTFAEVVAASSIIRPGVAESGMMQEYIVRHQQQRDGEQGGTRILDVHAGSAAPSGLMSRLLPETHGVMVYQEDVLRVAHKVGGMTLGEADMLRRIMSGKRKSEDEMARLERRFLDGARARGIPEKEAREIWRQMASFAGYSFCKGHSAAFAVLSYQVAYLKAHYPAEFFAALLTNGGGFYGAGTYVEEARRWGLEVLPPCVNESREDYTGRTLDVRPEGAAGWEAGAEEGGMGDGGERGAGGETETPSPAARGWVRVGLGAIMGLSSRTRRRILAERGRGGPFVSLRDFVERTGAGAEECRALARAGALDGVEPSLRNLPVEALRPALLLDLACLLREREAGGADSFVRLEFPLWKPPAAPPRAPSAGQVAPSPASGLSDPPGCRPDSLSLAEICRLEAEHLGFMVSGHPLDFVTIPGDVVPAREIRRHAGRQVRMAGWRIAAKLLEARNTGRLMKMLTLEDRTDTFEAVLFPRVYARYAPRTLSRGPYLAEGRVDMSLGSPTLNVERIEVLED